MTRFGRDFVVYWALPRLPREAQVESRFLDDVNKDIRSIVDEIRNEMKSYKNGGPRKDQVLLKLLSVNRAITALSSAIPSPLFYREFRRPTLTECRLANIGFFIQQGQDGKDSSKDFRGLFSFFFYETFGIRATILLDYENRISRVMEIRRIDTQKSPANDCLKSAQKRLASYTLSNETT